MATYSFVDPQFEQQGLEELEVARRRLDMLRQQATPDLGARIVALHQAWPDIAPGALVGMAMAGIDPLSDVAQDIERRSVQNASRTGFRSPGEVVDAQMEQRRHDAERGQKEDGGIGSSIMGGLRAGARGAFMGMETAFEEVSRRATSGLVAMQDDDLDYAGAMELATPSMGALLTTDEFGWEDLGDGWLPGGAVRERQEELKERLTLQGEWMSPGRAVAINVTEPGTRAFNFTSGLIDASFRIFGDPSTYALGGLGKVRHANKAFATDSALIRGLRRTTDENYAREWWLGSAPGQRLRESLVDESSPYEVWRRLGGPQGKVDRETARMIADATDARMLDEVVIPRLGPQGIAEKPVGGALSRGVGMMFGDDLGAVHGVGIHVRRGTDNVRMLNWMPDATIDTSDPDRAMTTLHRFLQGIKATDDEAATIMNRAFRIGSETDRLPQGGNWMELAKDLTELASERAIRDSIGVPRGAREINNAQKIRQTMGRAFKDESEKLTAYFTREAGRPRSHVPTTVGGNEIDYERVPHLVSEYLNRNIPLPDMQDLRRHIGTYAKAMRATNDLPRPLIEGTTNLMTGFMTGLWKPMVLLRGAYIARVVGEEQMRMAANGMDSLFRHPMSYLAYQTGRRGSVGLDGDPVRQMLEFQSVAQRKGGGWIRQPGAVQTEDWIRYRRGRVPDEQFAGAWADDFSRLVNDDVSSVVARLGPKEAKVYLASAKGKHMVREVASADHNRAVATSPGALDDYVDTVWARIQEKTLGDSELINAIATGQAGGRNIRWTGPTERGIPSELQKTMRAAMDRVDIQEVSGRRFLTTGKRGSSSESLLARYNQAVDIGADIIMSKPTNQMSRFPTWQQAFVKNIEDQLGFMDAGMQRRVIEWASTEANLSRTQVARMRRTARAGQGTSITDIETAEMIAKAAATRDTRKLLYELTERGQFSDAMSASMPFAEAWKEILTSWGRIVRDRPTVARRGQQVIEGARGSGFFYTDPQSGEEMFAYPGGKFVSRAMLGGHADSAAMQGALSLPGVGALATLGLGVSGAMMGEQEAEFELGGAVTGLNLFAGTLMPGIGPAVTVPTSLVLPDKPQFDWLRDNVLFPFGEPDVESGVFEALLPAWADKMRTAWMDDPDSDRIYANSVFDVSKALMASGEFSTDSPEEIDRLLTTSKQRARSLWLIRGASQFVVPTGPQARFRVKDLEGEWWPIQVAATEFHRMSREVGQEEAVEDFLATFGTDMISLIQSKSREITPRPTTEVGDMWIRENQDLVNLYPLTSGLMAPDDPLGEFHYGAYHRQFQDQTREQLTSEQMTWLANNTLGNFAYSHGVERIDLMIDNEAEARQARAALRSQLMERFPGFNSHLGVRDRPRVEDQIRELEAAVEDDRLGDNPAAQAAADYLEVRRQANLMVSATATRSTSFTRSRETAWIREWLRGEAERIGARHPEFIPLWDRVFSRELADDDVTEPGQIGAASG